MYTQTTVQFTSDGYRLAGTLHFPIGPAAAAVIGCHGLLADRSSPKQIVLAQALNRLGIAYLRFDHRGCGQSQGHFDLKTLLDSRCRDLCSAIAYLQDRGDVGAVMGLFGSSFGGTVVLATAAGRRMSAVVTYAAPVHSHAVGEQAGREIRAHHAIPDQDLKDFAFDIRNRLGMLKNILIMHGEKDEIVPSNHARSIYEAAQDPKKLICFENGDHRMTNVDHQHRFIEACTAWFEPFAC
jgi:uncharacterized protein